MPTLNNPTLNISLSKVHSNAKIILNICRKHNIEPCAVTKGVCADIKIAEALVNAGFNMLADSRMENLLDLRMAFPSIKLLNLRIPMISEMDRLVETVDYSIISEWESLIAMNSSAKKFNKVMKVIPIMELGDLREGMHEEELLALLPHFANYHPKLHPNSTTVSSELDAPLKDIQSNRCNPIINSSCKLDNIYLAGIAANHKCLSGVLPDHTNLGKFAEIADKVNNHFDLEIVSGGNSSAFYMMDSGSLPSIINNLRLGESVLLGRERAFWKPISGCCSDAFTIHAEIVELKSKQSLPIGTIGMNAFGETPPPPKDKGVIKRAILAIGEQDIEFENLTPLENGVEILGASSDHLIVDVSGYRSNLRIGDSLRFGVNYSTMMKAFTSKYVNKKYI
ncbi:hypothetical protein P9112_006433 [Eukaryota sp. TZLM1-RC]